MELYQLKTFVKVADEGSLTRASNALFTSQPAISAHIKALEEELGVVLFRRTPKGMVLTSAGVSLYESAVGTLQSVDDLKSQAQSLRGELAGDVRIGINSDHDFLKIGRLLKILGEKHPRLRPHLVQSMSARIVEDLKRDVLDAGFVFGDCDDDKLAPTLLYETPMTIVAPSGWKNLVEGKDLRALAELEWVYATPECPFYVIFERIFSTLNVQPKAVAWVDSEDAVRELVRTGTGVSLLRKYDAERLEKEAGTVCWNGQLPNLNLHLAVLKRRANDPQLITLVDEIKQLWLGDALALEDSIRVAH